MEGTHPFHPNSKRGPTPFTPPVVEHHHTEARSITVAPIRDVPRPKVEGLLGESADWGSMISDASGFFQYGYWWFLLFPSVALLTTTLAFNIFGDSVRDALDPRGAGIYV